MSTITDATATTDAATGPDGTQTPATMPVSASRPDTENDNDNARDDADSDPVWIPAIKFVVGVLVVLAALTFSEHIAEPISRFSYVPVMFCYVIVMMIGGGLMVSGFMALWRKATTPSNPQQ